MKRKLRVGVASSVFLAALLFGWSRLDDSRREPSRDAVTETAMFPSRPADDTHRRAPAPKGADEAGRKSESGAGRGDVEIPKLAGLLGEDLKNRFEKGGPFEPKDLPSVGRALRRMEGVIEELWNSGDSAKNAEAQKTYLQLQKKYALILSMIAKNDRDTEARGRLERFRREREKLLEQYGEGGASGRDGRDRDLARLKREILRGEGEVRESSSEI